jgi:hypothetical protein
VVCKAPKTAFYFIQSAMTGFTTSTFLSRNRVSLKEAFEGLELCEGKLSRTVLRGLDGSNPVRLLGDRGPMGLAIKKPQESLITCDPHLSRTARRLLSRGFMTFSALFRLDSHFLQRSAKVLEEQVEMRFAQTVISGPGMRAMNLFACVHSTAEEHGNEHNLPGAEVRHVSLLKEVAKAIILQNLLVEPFRGSLDNLMSAD